MLTTQPSRTAGALGTHVLLDTWFAPGQLEALTIDWWHQTLAAIADKLGLVVLAPVAHDFGLPGAVTVLLLLSTSHLSVHTWPEQRYAAIDLFTCGPRPLDLPAAMQLLELLPEVTSVKLQLHHRGIPHV